MPDKLRCQACTRDFWYVIINLAGAAGTHLQIVCVCAHAHQTKGVHADRMQSTVAQPPPAQAASSSSSSANLRQPSKRGVYSDFDWFDASERSRARFARIFLTFLWPCAMRVHVRACVRVCVSKADRGRLTMFHRLLFVRRFVPDPIGVMLVCVCVCLSPEYLYRNWKYKRMQRIRAPFDAVSLCVSFFRCVCACALMLSPINYRLCVWRTQMVCCAKFASVCVHTLTHTLRPFILRCAHFCSVLREFSSFLAGKQCPKPAGK